MKLTNYLLAGLLCFSFAITSCKKDDDDDNSNNPSGPSNLGWKGSDDPSQIPSSITNNFGFGNTNLPSSVDLTPKFPPIGDQGQYGTCVAWAAGYNLKTALNGLDLNLSPAQLASPANHNTAPKICSGVFPTLKKAADAMAPILLMRWM